MTTHVFRNFWVLSVANCGPLSLRSTFGAPIIANNLLKDDIIADAFGDYAYWTTIGNPEYRLAYTRYSCLLQLNRSAVAISNGLVGLSIDNNGSNC